MAIPFLNTKEQFLDPDGNPYSYGRVYFYSAGTTTLKTIWQSESETVGNEAQNPMPLDAGGYSENANGVWLGTGDYKVVLQKFTGEDEFGVDTFADVWTKDDIPGVPALSDEIVDNAVVNYCTDLRTIVGGVYDAVYCISYDENIPTGGGWFLWDGSSGLADDGGSIFSPLGAPASGRWVRVFESMIVTPDLWGAVVNDLTVDNQGAFTNMDSYCQTNPECSVLLPTGSWNISGDIEFRNAYSLTVMDGVIFTNELSASPAIITISSKYAEMNTRSPLADQVDTKLIYTPVSGDTARLIWFDDYAGVIVSRGGLLEWIQTDGISDGASIILDNSLRIDNTATPNLSGHKVIFEDDSFIQLDGQGFTVGDYENRTGGQVWDGDIDLLTVETNKKIIVDDFVSGLAITSAEMLDLINYATSSGTEYNRIYYTRGAYTYDSAGAPSGDTFVIHVFENGSTLDITGVFSVGGIEGSNCISGTGRVTTLVEHRLEWFTTFDQAISSAELSTNKVLDCEYKSLTFTSTYTKSLTNAIEVKNLNVATAIDAIGTYLLNFSGALPTLKRCNIISSSDTIGLIQSTSGLILRECYLEGHHDNSINYLVDVTGIYECSDSKIILSVRVTDGNVIRTSGPYYDIKNTYILGTETTLTDGDIAHSCSGLPTRDSIVDGYTIVGTSNVIISNTPTSSFGTQLKNSSIDCFTLSYNTAGKVFITGNSIDNISSFALTGKDGSTTFSGLITDNIMSNFTISTSASSGHDVVFEDNQGIGLHNNFVGVKTDSDTGVTGAGALTADFSDIPFRSSDNILVEYHLNINLTSGVGNNINKSGIITTAGSIASVPYNITFVADVDCQFTQLNKEQR